MSSGAAPPAVHVAAAGLGGGARTCPEWRRGLRAGRRLRSSKSLTASVTRAGALGALVLAVSAAGGAAAAALFGGSPRVELLNWTPSPLLVRQMDRSVPAKVPAGKTRDLTSPTGSAIHVEVERSFDGARCWATVNAGERVVVIARDGRIACEPVQGRRSALAVPELRFLYPGDDTGLER